MYVGLSLDVAEILPKKKRAVAFAKIDYKSHPCSLKARRLIYSSASEKLMTSQITR
jgi:hypothetical protein